MKKSISELNIARIGSDITYSSLKKIGAGILESFRNFIKEVNFSHHDSPGQLMTTGIALMIDSKGIR